MVASHPRSQIRGDPSLWSLSLPIVGFDPSWQAVARVQARSRKSKVGTKCYGHCAEPWGAQHSEGL